MRDTKQLRNDSVMILFFID